MNAELPQNNGALNYRNGLTVCALVVHLLCISRSSNAQFTTVIDAPPTVVGDNQTLGSDTQLNVYDGGVVGHFLHAGLPLEPSTNIEVNVYGDSVGNLFYAFEGSIVNISGGSIGASFHVYEGSVVNVSGGVLVGMFVSGTANITGGSVAGIHLFSGGAATISGGSLGEVVGLQSGSVGTLIGGEFRIDGQLVSGLESIGNSVAIDVPAGAVLSGVLADGELFILSSSDADTIADGTLTLRAAPIPAVGPALISVPADPAPKGIREGQELLLSDGGILGLGFTAGYGSKLTITGGSVGTSLEAVDAEVVLSGGAIGFKFDAFQGTDVTISGGMVGQQFVAHSGSNVTMSGGSVGSHFAVKTGSLANISGGTVGDSFQAGGIVNLSAGSMGSSGQATGTLNVTGGSIGNNFVANAGSRVIVSGGTVGNDLTANTGSVLTISGGAVGDDMIARPGSEVTLSGGTIGDDILANSNSMVKVLGGEFRLNGVPIEGLANVGDAVQVQLLQDAVLSGIFADGMPFAFIHQDSDFFSIGSLTLNVSALPDVGPATIQVPSDSPPSGIREGQTLTLAHGGAMGNNFFAGFGSQVTITGGTVGNNFEAVGANITIFGGIIGSGFDAAQGEIEISGGTIGNFFDALPGSIVNLSSGTIGLNASVCRDSVLTVSGGVVRAGLNGLPGSRIVVNGGSIHQNVEALQSKISLNSGTVDRDFRATESEVDVSGGQIGDFFNLVRTNLHISDGAVGRSMHAITSQVTITGGSVGDDFRTEGGTVIDITGGTIGEDLVVNGSTINMAGGAIGDNVDLNSGSTLNMSGGTVGNNFDAFSNSRVNLFGVQFVLNGVDITPTLQVNTALVISARNVTLEGILADQSPFSFYLNSIVSTSFQDFFHSGALLTVTLVLPGDHNLDGAVDAADYVAWRKNDGTQQGYDTWWANFGRTAGGGNGSEASLVSQSSVPEPFSYSLALLAVMTLVSGRRGARSTNS